MFALSLRRLIVLTSCVIGNVLAAGETYNYDVVVYGASPAGITASVQAARMGQSVVLIEPTRHLGGMTTSGATSTDPKLAHVVGGIAREFHENLWTWYADDSRWLWEKRGDFAGFTPSIIEPDNKRMWACEPHVAERVFDDLLRRAKVHVILGQPLGVSEGVQKDGPRIISIQVKNGTSYKGKAFVDATYEGDLMASAGVTHRLGRETNAEYGETFNGIRAVADNSNWEKWKLDPYVTAGKPNSGTLTDVRSELPGESGPEMPRLTSGGLHLCVTKIPGNRLEWAQPVGYNAADHELAIRLAQQARPASLFQFISLPNSKASLVLGPELTALLSNLAVDYFSPEGQVRRRIFKGYRDLQLGLLWTLANDERVPEATRKRLQDYGPCRDEWTDNSGVPPQLDVSGVRRMVSTFVWTERHAVGEEPIEDSVGLNSGTLLLDAQALKVSKVGHLEAESSVIQERTPQPVSFRSIFPKPSECTNLLVPVCLSASHVAYGTLRCETMSMVLGQSAGTAAALAIEGKVDVAALDYQLLRTRLLADGQVLEDDQLRREVKLKINKEKAAADSVLSDLDRKTQERTKARAAAQEKRKQQEGNP